MSDLWANRIVSHAMVPVGAIIKHPANWRIHGRSQQAALSGLLHEVGLVQSVIINQRTGRLVDGHLRLLLAMQEGQPDLPVVYVDLSEDEEAKVLAALDPIGALADRDDDKLSDLLKRVEADDEGLNKLLEELATSSAIEPLDNDLGEVKPDEDEGDSGKIVYETCPKCGHKYVK